MGHSESSAKLAEKAIIIKRWVLDVVVIPLRHVRSESTSGTIDWVGPYHCSRAILSSQYWLVSSASIDDAPPVDGDGSWFHVLG